MLSRQTIAGGLLALLLIGGGCDSASAPAENKQAATPRVVAAIPDFVYYEEADLKFKMQVPKDWEKDRTLDEGDIVTAFYSPFENSSDVYHENVVITALKVPADIEVSIQDFIDQSHEGLKQSVEKLVTKDAGNVSIGGAQGKKQEFTGQLNVEGTKINIKGEEYFLIHNGVAYNFTIGGAASKFDSFKPTFTKILDSIELK